MLMGDWGTQTRRDWDGQDQTRSVDLHRSKDVPYNIFELGVEVNMLGR